MKPLYIFATSHRPDPYINTIAHSIDHLQITEINIVVISEHNYTEEGQEDNLLASTVVSNISNQLRALTSGNYIKNWYDIITNSTFPLLNKGNIKIYERCLESMNKSGTSWKVIPILNLDKTLEEYVSKSPCIIDVSALKKNLLIDVVTTLLSINFTDVYSFELINKPTYDQKDLYHNLRPQDDYIFRNLAISDSVKKSLDRIDRWSESTQATFPRNPNCGAIDQQIKDEGSRNPNENKLILNQQSKVEELQNQIEELKNKKTNCDEEAKFRARIYSLMFFVIFIGIISGFLYCALFLETQFTKLSLSIFSICLIVFGYIWSAINLKEWSPTKFPEQILDKEKKRIYEKFGFDEAELNLTTQDLIEAKKKFRETQSLIDGQKKN